MRTVRDERLARVALCRLTEPADPRVSSGIAELGAVGLLDRLMRSLRADELAADAAQRQDDLDPVGDLRRAERLGIRFVVPGDEEWPEQLDLLAGAEPVGRQHGTPLGLWVRGPLHLAQATRRAVAVVGARSATSYGGDVAVELAAGLAGAGYTVVSGGAFGIDVAAHRGAIAGGGPTITVMACGPDRIYPQEHRELIEHIAATGLLVSDLAPGCTPTKWRFLARNRIIAALGLGTVVVEAALRSGALNTASWTDSLLRPLMGVPGPVTSPTSAGVHTMIRSRGATLVTRVEEVLEVIAPSGEHLLVEQRGERRRHDSLDRRDQQVRDAVPVSGTAPASHIARLAGLSVPDVEHSLHRLVTLGHVESDGSQFRISRHERTA